MSVFVFFVRGLLKIDFSMRVFIFLGSGLLKMDFSMITFVFLASGIVENGAVPFFKYECAIFLEPELFFQ